MIYTRYTSMDVPGWYFPTGNRITITYPDGYFYSIPQSGGGISAPAGSTLCIPNWSVYALNPPDGMISIGFFIEYNNGKTDLVGEVSPNIGINKCGSGCCSVIPVGSTLFNISVKYKNSAGAWMNGTSTVGYRIDAPANREDASPTTTTAGSPSSGVSTVRVSIDSSPQGSDVIVNDVPTGKKTPCVLNLVPGLYSIEFRKDDYYQEMVTVEVKSDTPASVNADLDVIPPPTSNVNTTYKPPTDWSIKESEVKEVYGELNAGTGSADGDSAIILLLGAIAIGAFILLGR